jgi:hypothetical protein
VDYVVGGAFVAVIILVLACRFAWHVWWQRHGDEYSRVMYGEPQRRMVELSVTEPWIRLVRHLWAERRSRSAGG